MIRILEDGNEQVLHCRDEDHHERVNVHAGNGWDRVRSVHNGVECRVNVVTGNHGEERHSRLVNVLELRASVLVRCVASNMMNILKYLFRVWCKV